MSKRQSLRGKGIDSLLFGITEEKEEAGGEIKKKPRRVGKRVVGLRNEKKQAAEIEIERVTVPLKLSQVGALAGLERQIMKKRSREAKKQRITKNSIIRACLEVFLKIDFDKREIADEAELTRRIKKAVMS